MKLPVNYNNISSGMRKAVREEYVRQQGGNCHHCGAPLTEKPAQNVLDLEVTESLFPPNFFRWPVHLHHCHRTGMTIGAVHARCNAVLWEYLGE